MSDEDLFVEEESARIEKALVLVDELLAAASLNIYEAIALGTCLQNVYTGVERILRCHLLERGIRIPASEYWHKELLQRSHKEGIVTDGEYNRLEELLGYRHMHVHGYGYMLKQERLRELAEMGVPVVRQFLARMK